MTEVEKNILDTKISSSSEFVSLIHNALDSYPVLIYNGADEPTMKNMPQAMTSISYDLKNVKTQNIELSSLVEGIKHRKEFVSSFSNTMKKLGEYLNINKKWKILLFVIQTVGALYGFSQILLKLLGL